MIKEGVQITNLFKKGDTMSTVLSLFVKALSDTNLLPLDLTPFTYLNDDQLRAWAADNVDTDGEAISHFVGIVSCFPDETEVSPKVMLGYICGSMCELPFDVTRYSAKLLFDVCAKVAYVQYLLERDEDLTCENGYILLCTGSHLLRPNKDNMWPAIRQCISSVSVMEGSGVKPWLPKKPK